MSVVERIMRQILPILVVAVGIVLLVDFYFVDTSEYFYPAQALMICGEIAPAIQQIGVALSKVEKRRVFLVACDGVATVLSLLILTLGDYVVSHVFDYPTVNYYLEPGPAIESTAALIVSVLVLVVAFWPVRVSEKIQ